MSYNINQLSDSFFIGVIEKELNFKFKNYKVKRDIAFDHVTLCIYHDSLSNGTGMIATVYLYENRLDDDIVVSITIKYNDKKHKCLAINNVEINQLGRKALLYVQNLYFFLEKQNAEFLSVANHLIVNKPNITISFKIRDVLKPIICDMKYNVSSSYTFMFENHKCDDLFNYVDNQYNLYFLKNGVDAKEMGYKEKFELFEMMVI